MAGATDPDPSHRPLALVTQEHVERVLASVKGNKTRAAKILGINRRTLIRMQRRKS